MSRAREPAVGEYWSVWVRGSNGHLLAKTVNTLGVDIWVDHGTGGADVGSKGVTARGWVSGANVYERAFYVNPAGSVLYERKLVNRVADPIEPWRVITPPGSPVKTLTGQIAATWNYQGGVRRIRLFATTTDLGVWVYNENTSTGAGTWSQLGANYSTSAPLAASQSPDGIYARAFAANAAGTNVQMFRHDGTAWAGYPQGQPAGIGVFGTVAAAEDQLNGSLYRGYLFCTKTGAPDARLYYAYATSANDTSWAWLSLPLPAGQARNSGYALTATSRANGATRAINAYLLDTSTNPTRLYHTERVSGGTGLTALADLGADGETYRRLGGLASAPVTNYAYVYFVGEESGSFAQRLYRRFGDPDAGASDPWNWANHGSATGTAVVTDADSPHSESSTATWNAKGLTAAILRPTPAADARVEWTWSTDDGDSWSAPLAFAEIKESMDYMVDPTVDFDDSGTGYVLVENIDWVTTCGAGNISEASAFYRTTTGGALWSDPVEIANTASLDHPWIAIDRIAGAPDRIHFVWARLYSGESWVEYRNQLVGGGLGATQVLYQAGAPVVTVGASSTVWAASNRWVCRLTDQYDNCSGGPVNIPNFTNQSLLQVQGTSLKLRVGANWSAKASMAVPNRLYYAFMVDETNGDGPDLDNDEETDVMLIVATYNPANETITLSPQAPVTVVNDDADQFGPAVTITRDYGSTSEHDNVFVTWYDRRSPTPGCPISPNRCFRAKRNRSFDGGMSFLPEYTQDIPIDAQNSLSDPALLPPHCKVANLAFHGDYHEARGELLHSRHVVVGAPLGSLPGTATLTGGWVSGGWWYW